MQGPGPHEAHKRVSSRGMRGSRVWIHLGIGLMGGGSVSILPNSGGQDVSFPTPHPIVGGPCEHPFCPQHHHSASMGWTVPSLLQVSWSSLVPGGGVAGVASLPSTPLRCLWVSGHRGPCHGLTSRSPGPAGCAVSLGCPRTGFSACVICEVGMKHQRRGLSEGSQDAPLH